MQGTRQATHHTAALRARSTPPSPGPAGGDARHSRAQAAHPPPQRGPAWPAPGGLGRPGAQRGGGGRAGAPSLRRQPDSMSRPDASADDALAPRSSFQGTAFSPDSPACRAARCRICARRRGAAQWRADGPWQRDPDRHSHCARQRECPRRRRAAHAASLPSRLACQPRSTDCTGWGRRPACVQRLLLCRCMRTPTPGQAEAIPLPATHA